MNNFLERLLLDLKGFRASHAWVSNIEFQKFNVIIKSMEAEIKNHTPHEIIQAIYDGADMQTVVVMLERLKDKKKIKLQEPPRINYDLLKRMAKSEKVIIPQKNDWNALMRIFTDRKIPIPHVEEEE